jgi:hypothetical protein
MSFTLTRRLKTQTTKLDDGKVVFKPKEVNFRLSPYNITDLKKVVILGLESAIIQIGNRLFAAGIIEENIDFEGTEVAVKVVKLGDMLTDTLKSNQTLELVLQVGYFTVATFSSPDPLNEAILIFFQGQLRDQLPTRSAKTVTIFKIQMKDSIGVCHFQEGKEKDEDYKDLQVHWIYMQHGKFVINKVQGAEGYYKDSSLEKMTETILMIISKRKVQTLGKSLGFNGNFHPAVIANSQMFGIYNYQEIKSIALASNRQLVILCIRQPVDKEKEIYEEFHMSYTIHELSMILEVDNTLRKEWREKEIYIGSGIWCSSKGYFLYFLSKKENGLFFNLSYLDQEGFFTGQGHSFLVSLEEHESDDIEPLELSCLSKKKGEFIAKYLWQKKPFFVGFKVNFMALIVKPGQATHRTQNNEMLEDEITELDMCQTSFTGMEKLLPINSTRVLVGNTQDVMEQILGISRIQDFSIQQGKGNNEEKTQKFSEGLSLAQVLMPELITPKEINDNENPKSRVGSRKIVDLEDTPLTEAGRRIETHSEQDSDEFNQGSEKNKLGLVTVQGTLMKEKEKIFEKAMLFNQRKRRRKICFCIAKK